MSNYLLKRTKCSRILADPDRIWISKFKRFGIRIESGSLLVGSGSVPDLLVCGFDHLSFLLTMWTDLFFNERNKTVWRHVFCGSFRFGWPRKSTRILLQRWCFGFVENYGKLCSKFTWLLLQIQWGKQKCSISNPIILPNSNYCIKKFKLQLEFGKDLIEIWFDWDWKREIRRNLNELYRVSVNFYWAKVKWERIKAERTCCP